MEPDKPVNDSKTVTPDVPTLLTSTPYPYQAMRLPGRFIELERKMVGGPIEDPSISCLSLNSSATLCALAVLAYVAVVMTDVTSHIITTHWLPFGIAYFFPPFFLSLALIVLYATAVHRLREICSEQYKLVPMARPIALLAGACCLWAVGNFIGGHPGLLFRDVAIIFSTFIYAYLPSYSFANHLSIPAMASAPTPQITTIGSTDTNELRVVFVTFCATLIGATIVLPLLIHGGTIIVALCTVHFGVACLPIFTAVRLRHSAFLAISHGIVVVVNILALGFEIMAFSGCCSIASVCAWILGLHSVVLMYFPVFYIGRILSGQDKANTNP